jgi:hypothetical protein
MVSPLDGLSGRGGFSSPTLPGHRDASCAGCRYASDAMASSIDSNIG